MADYKIVDAGKLEEDLTVLADAIRQRSGTSGKMDFPSGMADTVANIPSEGLTLPELADPATARDMVLGKQLYDSSGQPVTGNIPEFSGDQVAVANISELYHINNYVRVTGITSLNSRYDGLLLRPGTQQRIFVPDDQFGDADAGDVAKGKTFTSAAGLLVEGTHECEAGVTLPELTNPATAADLALDKQLIDGSGNILTGTLPESGVDTNVMAADAAFWGNSLENTQFSLSGVYSKGHIGDADFRGFICRPGTNFVLRNIPTSLFGDATADQVAKGATFTSAAGLLVEGTMEPASGSGTPGITVIQGEYIPGTTVPGMAGSFLKIDHNIGEVKPFAFHMEIADPSKAGGDNCIIAVNISMLSYDTKTISYSDKTADITPIATVQVKQANNINRGNNPSSVNVYDTTEAANASGNATNFNLKVWPDGFKTALYQALQSGAVYNYTLVYGM